MQYKTVRRDDRKEEKMEVPAVAGAAGDATVKQTFTLSIRTNSDFCPRRVFKRNDIKLEVTGDETIREITLLAAREFKVPVLSDAQVAREFKVPALSDADSKKVISQYRYTDWDNGGVSDYIVTTRLRLTCPKKYKTNPRKFGADYDNILEEDYLKEDDKLPRGFRALWFHEQEILAKSAPTRK